MRPFVITSSALAAAAAVAVVLLPRSAGASTPEETFARMGAAFSMAAHRGEISIRVATSKDGTVHINGTLDGVALPQGFPIETQVQRTGDICDVRIKIDFDPAEFQSIRFGQSHNVLEVTQKQSPDTRLEIGLDPKTYLPSTLTTMVRNGSDWRVDTKSKYKTQDVAAPAKPAHAPALNARVLVRLGQDAQITVTN